MNDQAKRGRGRPKVDDTKKNVIVRMTDDLRQKVETVSDGKVSTFVRDAVEEKLKRVERSERKKALTP